jgi:nucleoside 2-deoxyribosyltransferase
MKYVYLCGQITGLSYEAARYGWREQVCKAVSGTNICAISPMRAKDSLSQVNELSCWGDPASVLSCPKGLTTRDRYDVERSDIIFANLLGMDRVSVGSMIEFGWADAMRIPILCVMEEDNPHQHAMVLDVVGWQCHTLEEGIAVMKAVLQEGI